MSETRRGLFRTSVLAALGGVTAGALAACAAGNEPDGKGGRPRPFVSTLAGSVVAVYDQGSTKSWYFFVFGPSAPLTCVLWKANLGTPFPVIVPSPTTSGPSLTNAIDTYSWFQQLSSHIPPLTSEVQNATNLAIQYTANPNPSISVTTDASGNLASLKSVLDAFVDMQQYPGSWNEIGKN